MSNAHSTKKENVNIVIVESTKRVRVPGFCGCYFCYMNIVANLFDCNQF